jgi:SAM-dependent methyltransferase
MADKEDSHFDGQFLEDTRRFMLTEGKVHFMYQHLGVIRDQTILDVGCGTGYFSRQIARYTDGTGRVIGLDIDPKLLDAARRLCRERELFNLEFVEGDALQLQYPEGTFDITLCHLLLCILPEPHAALAEMVRVTRLGGRVAAVEPCVGAMGAYYAGHQHLTDLLNRTRRAVNTAEWELYGIDQSIGPRLPEMFVEQGLQSVRTEIIAMPLTPYPFSLAEMTEELKAYYERQLTVLDQPEEQILSDEKLVAVCEKYGISREEQLECQRLQVQYVQGILHARDVVGFVNALELIPMFAVTGQKSG